MQARKFLAARRTSFATIDMLSPSAMTESPSTRSATSWVTTSACRWPSRVRPKPLPSVTATVSRATGSWGMAYTKLRAAPGLLRMPRSLALTYKPQPADGECTSQRQRQARAGGAADAQRVGKLGDLVRAVLESVSIETPHPGGRGYPDRLCLPSDPPPDPFP
eukprot:450565-Pleurochrysis_carterae.AAC.1